MPRPVNASSTKVAIPIWLRSFSQSTTLPPTPPEPWSSTTAGRRSLPARGIFSCPASVTGLASLRPLRKSWSLIVSDWIGTTSTLAIWARHSAGATAKAAVEIARTIDFMASSCQQTRCFEEVELYPHAGGRCVAAAHETASEGLHPDRAGRKIPGPGARTRWLPRNGYPFQRLTGQAAEARAVHTGACPGGVESLRDPLGH